MVMGLLGGIFGVFGGFVAGKLLGVVLSVFSLAKGVGWIDVSYIPPVFVAIVLVLSFVVGVVTGIYPARRATKISALNALRYE
jgi:putative ABC transport system permease protein